MITAGRPTLRCLSDDLDNDWDSTADQHAVSNLPIDKPLPSLGHPIIRKTAADFPSDPGDSERPRESISGLTNPMWWKAKIGSRWRGAVYEDPTTGQAWLCAAGYRREREASDFYKQFMADVEARGAEWFLPTDEDRARLAAETRGVRVEQWELAAQASARGLATGLWREGGEQSLELTHPENGEAIARLTVSIERETLDSELVLDLTVSVGCLNYEFFPLVCWLELVCLTALDSREQRWSSMPVGGVPTHSQMLVGDEIDDLLQTYQVPQQPGTVTPGSEAHYAHADRLTESTIEGEGVKALCGAFFVPRQDHGALETCPSCAAIIRVLPE